MNYIVCLHNLNLNNKIEKKVMEKYIVENQKKFFVFLKKKKREIFISKKIFLKL